MKPSCALTLLILLAVPAAAAGGMATAKQLRTLDRQFAAAEKTRDLAKFRATRDKADALIAQLKRANKASAQPKPLFLDPCYKAATLLTNARAFSWMNAQSPKPSEADKRLDAANYADYQAALAECQHN